MNKKYKVTLHSIYTRYGSGNGITLEIDENEASEFILYVLDHATDELTVTVENIPQENVDNVENVENSEE